MLEVNPGWGSLSVGKLFDSRGFRLITVEVVSIGFTLGSARGRLDNNAFLRGAE